VRRNWPYSTERQTLVSNRLLANVGDVKILATQLALCEEVTRYDTQEENEAWTLALTFQDLEDSFRTFLDDQLPRLCNGQLSPEETYDLLLDIGEEFRHILYHLNDTRFYDHLRDQQEAQRPGV
jgi:hypothetical protein